MAASSTISFARGAPSADLLPVEAVRAAATAALDSDSTRALSYGTGAGAKAAWVDGFFADGAVLLVHDPALRGLLDAWVGELGEHEFVDVLPLVRRTFGTFSIPQRRALAARLAAPEPDQRAAPEVANALAAPALATVDLILAASRG